MARDNADQIPIEDIDWAPGPPYLDRNPRKDKMRGITKDGDIYFVEWEKVTGWKPTSPPGEFGDLWIVRRSGSRWKIEFGASLYRGDDDTSVRLELDIEPGETIGYFIHARTQNARAAIRTWAAPGPPPPDPEDPVEPDSILDTVEEVRAKYPTPLPNDDCGALLNEVAWKERADGWGLAAKASGAHSEQPKTGVLVSRDLLIHKPSGLMYDVLADVGNTARPVWQPLGDADLPWVPPVETDGTPPPVEDDYKEGWIDALDQAAVEVANLLRAMLK